jgi:hypothetical protein
MIALANGALGTQMTDLTEKEELLESSGYRSFRSNDVL